MDIFGMKKRKRYMKIKNYEDGMRTLSKVVLWTTTAWAAYKVLQKITEKSSMSPSLSFVKKNMEAKKSITINKSAEDLYDFWRRLPNLSKIMPHVEQIREDDERHSHWIANSPIGKIEWDAEITEDEKGRKIAWRSVPGAEFHTEGHVEFQHAPGGRGTEVKSYFRYETPGGKLGSIVSNLFKSGPAREVSESLRRLKRLMETGEAILQGGGPR